MTGQILFPVDFQPEAFRLYDFVHFFSPVDVRFVGFFLSDFEKPPIEGTESLLLQEKLIDEAKRLQVDLSFYKNQKEGSAFWSQSKFADLLVINPFNNSTASAISQTFPDCFFKSVGCPVVLSHNLNEPGKDVVFLLDYDEAGINALKSYLQFFNKKEGCKRITILTVNADVSEIHLEKYLVHHVKKNFSDVGIVPINQTDLLNHAIQIAAKSENSVLIMGKAVLNLLSNEDLLLQAAAQRVSIYYSTT